MESLLRINVSKPAISLRTVSLYTLSWRTVSLYTPSLKVKNITKNITDNFVLFSGVVVPAGEKYYY